MDGIQRGMSPRYSKIPINDTRPKAMALMRSIWGKSFRLSKLYVAKKSKNSEMCLDSDVVVR